MTPSNHERRGSYQKCNISANVDIDDGSDVESNHTSSFYQQQIELLRRHQNGRIILYFAISVCIGWILANAASILKSRHYEKESNAAIVNIPNLIWSDEFDGDSIDFTKWSFVNGNGCDVGLCGWGNNELEWYTPSNTKIADGKLVIEARKFDTRDGPSSYTSSKIISRGKADFGLADSKTDDAKMDATSNTYITSRRFEASLRLPWGHGIWPAFWMLPTFDTFGGWPKSGEIDIMENIGKEGPNTVHGTVHYGLDGPQHQYSESGITIAAADDLNNTFHTYAVERHNGVIQWYIDDIQYSSITRLEMKPYLWPFDQEFYFIINLAVGGNWPGNPVDSANSTEEVTVFPQQLAVDYVRVYEGVFPRLVGNNIVKCKERGAVYEITNLDRVSEYDGITYSWTIPDGATIIEGEGTSSIRVDFDSFVYDNNINDSEVIRVQAYGLTSQQVAHSIGLAKLQTGIGMRIKVVDYDGTCSGNSSANPVPRFKFDCGRPDTCTEYVLHRTTDEFTCGERIQYLMKEQGMSEMDACREVGYRQFHGHCGPCNPIPANEEDRTLN